jgi:tetratricopeptide (TPR) repeat protein
MELHTLDVMRFGTLALIWVLGCAGACRSMAEPERAEPVVTPDPLPVAVDGCDGLGSGPRCVQRRPASIRMWLAGEHPADALVVTFDDAPLPPIRVEADVEGVLLEVMPPRPDGMLALVHADGRRFELEVAPERATYLAVRTALDAARKKHPIAEVRRRLAEQRADLDPADAHRLDCFDTELAFVAEDWTTVLQAPWRLDETPPELADLAALDRAHVQAAYVAIQIAADYAQAKAHLRAARAHPLNVAATVNADYFTGVLEQRLGRRESALEQFDRAARLARRVHLDRDLAAVVAQQAVVLGELGRFDEIEPIVRDVESRLSRGDPLAADIRADVTWARMLWREDEPTLPDPSTTLRELIEHYEAHDDPIRATGARLNLAIAASQNGDLQEAARVLERVDRKRLSDRDQVFVEIVAGRVDEQRGRVPRARVRLERARLLAELSRDEALALRARLARAELERRAGTMRAARAEYEAAEAIETRLAMGIAPTAGRSAFSSARRRSRAHYVELLLEQRDPEAALCTVLGARARHLRSLAAGDEPAHDDAERLALLVRYEQRREELERHHEQSWALPADQLARERKRADRELAELDALLVRAVARVERAQPAWRCDDVRDPAPERGLLTMHPTAEDDGWWFLLDRGGEVEVRRVLASKGEEAEAASRAVAELEADGHLQGLRALTVVPLGAQSSTSFHGLASLRDDDGLQVTYALGLGASRPSQRRDRSAAVLVGAADDLREARAEAEEVRAALSRAGWETTHAWVPGQERQPTLLHYAGHGRHAGLSGWDSDLRLASGTLTSQQLIAHQRAPAVVVLGACEAGTSDIKVIDGGMNMAAAFLLAGAELVIAPESVVDDGDARALAQALYRVPPGPGGSRAVAASLVEALGASQRAEGRFTGWRAWVP